MKSISVLKKLTAVIIIAICVGINPLSMITTNASSDDLISVFKPTALIPVDTSLDKTSAKSVYYGNGKVEITIDVTNSSGAYDYGVIYDADKTTISEIDLTDEFKTFKESKNGLFICNKQMKDDKNNTYMGYFGVIIDESTSDYLAYSGSFISFVLNGVEEGDIIKIIKDSADHRNNVASNVVAEVSVKAPVPTQAPTAVPTKAPTAAPTQAPTAVPTKVPTAAPTQAPTAVPTKVPTVAPTQVPTAVPTKVPTVAPTPAPTAVPTKAPTAVPTKAPTAVPTKVPTAAPTQAPTAAPTQAPTVAPSQAPTTVPTQTPTEIPTDTPEPSIKPSGDINGDTKTDATDALLVLKHAAKIIILTDVQIFIGDVNRNSKLEAEDALLILKFAAKIINSFE